MKIVCRYKDGSCNVTFYVEVNMIDKLGFTGKYRTTIGRSKKTSYQSGTDGAWFWNNVKIIKIET